MKNSIKYIHEFRNPGISGGIINNINRAVKKNISLMEVCGTHTMAIAKHGIRGLITDKINLVSGPGCPVCVTAQGDVDNMIALSRIKGVIVVTFGDMLKVPGTVSNLSAEKERGADIRVVYSPLESVEIAKRNKSRKVVFLAIGFETTAPLIAACIKDAKKHSLKNYFIYSTHKLVIPAMLALLESPGVGIDGFICPGHVSVITGSKYYSPVIKKYGLPCVIAGFEPLDILQAIFMLVKQVVDGRSEIEAQYSRAVTEGGNEISKKLLAEVFSVSDACWRGLGKIRKSGLKLKSAYAAFDAEKEFCLKNKVVAENVSCMCGSILKGIKKPYECKLFKKKCTPDAPYGPCMVSSEGTCAAYYRYGGE